MAIMPSFIYGKRAAFGLKEVCLFPNNPSIDKDAHQGSELFHIAETEDLAAAEYIYRQAKEKKMGNWMEF